MKPLLILIILPITSNQLNGIEACLILLVKGQEIMVY